MRRKKKKSRVTLKKGKAVRPRHPRVCHRNDRYDKERKSLTVCPKYITVVKNEVFHIDNQAPAARWTWAGLRGSGIEVRGRGQGWSWGGCKPGWSFAPIKTRSERNTWDILNGFIITLHPGCSQKNNDSH